MGTTPSRPDNQGDDDHQDDNNKGKNKNSKSNKKSNNNNNNNSSDRGAMHTREMERDSNNNTTNRRSSSGKHRSSRDRDRDRDRDRNNKDRTYYERESGSRHSRNNSNNNNHGSASPQHGNISRSLSPLSGNHHHQNNGYDNNNTNDGNRSSHHDGRSSHHRHRKAPISDDSVNLDLNMADLMAYLQVVANNSSNLPLTRRDDPDLGRTVSSLTAEEYGTKCAAFVPSNVRILGGQFGRYGKVWDLPTSEEFDVVSSTREPGLSHGGACCNALLKAMYDTESEANNVAQGHMLDHKNLFDDDDDETVDTAGYTVDRTIASFDTLVLNDGTNPGSGTTMSWADLLRKMKTEMQGVGFNQFPALTSSYKFDLNAPFSLVPPDFKNGVNKKRALLIGCNYKKTPDAQLRASHDDVRSMKDFLVNVYGFPESNDLMTVLMDDKTHEPPTHQNITKAFKQLAEMSQPGDAVFVLFTGHGCRVLDSPIDSESESYDEAFLPSDFEETGIVRDTLLFKTLFAPMKKGVTVTCIIDCCHTGVMVDLPYLWSTKSDKGEIVPKMSLNNDFSFVRFLKVVKTLYESSVFTKIGKTVGSELDKQLPARDDETVTDGSLVTMPENEPDSSNTDTNSSIFQMLTCQVSKALAAKVINCTLHAPDEYSDDETIPHNNTVDEDDHDDDATTDTYGTGLSSQR